MNRVGITNKGRTEGRVGGGKKRGGKRSDMVEEKKERSERVKKRQNKN